jgi:hypothetical protein
VLLRSSIEQYTSIWTEPTLLVFLMSRRKSRLKNQNHPSPLGPLGPLFVFLVFVSPPVAYPISATLAVGSAPAARLVGMLVSCRMLYCAFLTLMPAATGGATSQLLAVSRGNS